jgi:plasmid stabilization system protein ParE
MKFAVKKRRLADHDAAAAADWYDEQAPGLGGDFLDEVNAALETLQHNALLYAIRFEDVRCLRLRRFKDYGVYYLMQGNEVWVLAILHGAREVQKHVLSRKSNG